MTESHDTGTSRSDGTAPAAMPQPTPARRRSARRTLALLAAITIAPVAASYAVYYFFPRDVQANHGTLLPTAPTPEMAGTRADGKPFRLAEMKGQWLLVVNAGERCAGDCERMLYATRQARTMQGREQERIARVLVVTDDGVLPRELALQHPALITARVDAAAQARLPGGAPSILLVDPLGNLVLRYAADPDTKGMARDLTRLLKASRIG